MDKADDVLDQPGVETIMATLELVMETRLRAGAFGNLRLDILFKGHEGITEFRFTEETIARPLARKNIAKNSQGA